MSAVPTPTARPAPGLERVEPQLRDLMALAGQAAALPSWSRGIRKRHSGQYLSRVRGRGMEYDESRPYQPGDDIRQLDWRVTARTGKAHTKLFREERERPVIIAVDYAPSMFFATRGVFKAVLAARIAALLAWHAQKSGDRIGGLVFSASAHHELQPRRGPAAVMRWLKLLAGEAPGCRRAEPVDHPAEAFATAVTRVRRIAKPGSLVFLISDFQALDDDAASELARIAAHTDLALIAVHDPIEASFPDLDQPGSLGDRRRTLRLANISAAQREHYAAQFSEHHARLRRLCLEQRMLFTSVETTGDAFGTLLRMLSR